MNLRRLTIRTRLALLLAVALSVLAVTRGLGLIQLGGYLERINSYTASLDRIHLQLQQLQEAHMTALREGRADAALQAAHESAGSSLRQQLATVRAEWAGTEQRERRIMYTTYVGMLVLVLVVGGAIYWLLMAMVVRPLRGVARVAHVVAAGDLTTNIEVRREDEIGHVMQALGEMNDSLGALIGKIRSVSQSLDASTAQIADAGGGLTRHVEAQSEFLQRTAATLRDLAGAVAANADNATRARQLAASARDVANRGGDEVGQAVSSMGSITASSKKIVDIVSIIDGITFQTNILALNAAVEAARAGEQGRGFAVVAAEVRSLAQRSAAAAKEIAALIDESVRELQRGGGLIEKAGATMVRIVEGARAVDDIMAKMAADAAQQRQVIEQVRATVDRVDQGSQQQALLADAADAAQSMRQQVAELMRAVSVFRLAQPSPTAVVSAPAMSFERGVRRD